MIELRANEPRPTPLLPGDPWTRLWSAYRRSTAGGEEAALLALELPDREPAGVAGTESRDRRLRELEGTLLTLPGAEGTTVARRRGRLIALLPRRSAKEGTELAEALVALTRRLAADGPHGDTVPVVGLSCRPAGAALHLETLVRVAEAGARVAGYRGCGGIVHTMLYDVIEEQVRREVGEDGGELAALGERHVPAKEGPDAPWIRVDEPHGDAPPSSAEEERILEDRVLGVVARQIAHELAETDPVAGADGGAAAGPLDELSRTITERVLAALRQQLAGYLETTGTRADGSGASAEIELLQRRIQKLVRILEQTEERLDEMERRCEEDPGVASVYRTVQGLSETEPGFERKQALMRQVLEANLALQHTIVARKRLPASRPLPGPARGGAPRTQRGAPARGAQPRTGFSLPRA